MLCQIYQLLEFYGSHNQILKIAAEAWIHAGGAHHTSFSFNVTPEQLADFAEMAGIECLFINKDTNLQLSEMNYDGMTLLLNFVSKILNL